MADPAAIRFNNPGAMWPGPSSKLFGATSYTNLNDGQGNRIAQFPDPESGAAAQFDLLRRGYTGMTLADAIKKWSGGNHSQPYVAHIAKSTGLAPTTVLTPELLSDATKAVPFAKAMAHWEAGRPYPMTDDQWNSAHKRYLGGPQTASTAAPQNYDMYGETVKPSPAPITTGSIQGRSMPQDPVTGAWTPEEVIKSQYGLAQQFRNTPDASTPLGALAKGLGGFFGGVYQGSADNTVRANQALRSQAVQGMAGETDSGALGRRLLGTGIPGLQEQGMALIAHSAQKKADLQAQGEMQRQNFEFQRKLAMDLKRQEEEMKMARFNAMLGNGPGVPQVPPAATSAMPSAPMSAPSSSVPSGVPGISMGAAPVPQAGQMPMASPMSGTDMPARAESPFDKRRLGMAVAAGVISPAAAKLLMESNKFDEAYDKEAGKDFAAAYKGYRDTLSKSSKMLGSYNTLEALIKNPATIQGMAAGARKTFDRTMELMGIKTEGLAPTQIMEALSNELTLQMRDAAGGMPGAMSDKDLGFLQAMMANTANSPEANLFLVQMRKRVLEREQTVAKLALKYAQNNGGRIDHKFDVLLQEWAEKNPLWSDKEMGTLSGQVEAVTKTPTVQAITQGPQAAAPSVDQVSSSPVGTVVNGMRKIGPNQWVREGSGASAPQTAQPTPPATQAQRVQAKREEAARAEAEKTAQAKQENDAFKAAFDADLRTMDPVDLARKYDNYRWQLGSSRAMALDDALKARVR